VRPWEEERDGTTRREIAMLQLVAQGVIWSAQQPLKFGPFNVRSRTTVVRLGDGSLWVHSPITSTASIVKQLDAIGEVRYVVAPNKSHYLFMSSFLEAYPRARGFAAPGLIDKQSDLRALTVLVPGAKQPLDAELEPLFIEGIPALNETVWFHASTGTLITTDLLFCFGKDNAVLPKLAARLLGVYEHLGMSRTMKLLVKDKAALLRTAERLSRWPVRRVILAHDTIVELQSPEQLAQAFEWLR
jgi:hypothetical protein